jgi:hypothetical protein
MSNSPVQKWFDELKRIWLEKDVAALQSILADNFEYYEDPYLPPFTTWQEVEAAWQEVKSQDIETLDIKVLIDGATEGSGMYHFIFKNQTGTEHESKGAYYLKLNEESKATIFRQWWTKKE